ncbi:MAG: DUF3786 domain-containing protein [Promethearchaeota archaeon]
MRDDQIQNLEKLWAELNKSTPEEIAKRTQYELVDGTKLKMPFLIYNYIADLKNHTIVDEKTGKELEKYSLYLAFLWYLVNAKDIPVREKWVTTKNLKQGAVFFVGNHALPEKPMLERFGTNVDEFEEVGKVFGGEEFDKGDVAFKFYLFPRVPIIIAMWEEDEEFDAQVKYLFDETIEEHLTKDIIHGLFEYVVHQLVNYKKD